VEGSCLEFFLCLKPETFDNNQKYIRKPDCAVVVSPSHFPCLYAKKNYLHLLKKG